MDTRRSDTIQTNQYDFYQMNAETRQFNSSDVLNFATRLLPTPQ